MKWRHKDDDDDWYEYDTRCNTAAAQSGAVASSPAVRVTDDAVVVVVPWASKYQRGPKMPRT